MTTTDRYGEPQPYGVHEVRRCNECSTRARVLLVETDAIAEHDLWHEGR